MEQVEAGMMAVGMDVESEGPAAASADLGGGGTAEGGRAGAGFYIFRRCDLPEEAATATDWSAPTHAPDARAGGDGGPPGGRPRSRHAI